MRTSGNGNGKAQAAQDALGHAIGSGSGAERSSNEIEALRRDLERFRFAATDRTLLHRVLEQSPYGVVVCDPAGKIVLQNRASERIWAGSASASSREAWRQYRAFHPDGTPYQPEDWPMARCLLHRETVDSVEFEIERFDGTRGWLLAGSAPLISAEGALEGAVSMFVDITPFKLAQRERDRLEQELQLLAEVGSLVSSELDEQGRLEQLVRALAPRFCDWAAVDLIGASGNLERAAVHHADPAQIELARELLRRYPPDPAAPRGVPNVVRTRQPEWVPELSPEELARSARDEEHLRRLRTLRISSYLVVPLEARGRVLGALTLVNAESSRRFSRHDLHVAQDLASRAALALDNARLFAFAEASRKHLHESFMQAPNAIAILRGPEHRYELANAGYGALVGNRPLVGKTIREALPELEGQGIYELLDRVYQTGEAFHGNELRVELMREGRLQETFFNFVYQPMRGPTGVEGVMVVANEVTGQVLARAREAQAAEMLRRRQAELALGASIGVAFTGSQSLREMLQSCAEAMVRHLGAAFARIWTLNEKAQMLELEASAGQYTHIDGAHARVPVGKLKIGLIAAEGKPHLTNDVQNDPRVGDRAWARREGMVSFAGYPLRVEGRVIGVMAMFARQSLSEETLSALASIADSVAIGIERKRAEARAKEERDTLEVVNNVGRTLAAELDHEKLVQAITDYATQLAGAELGAFFYNVVDERGGSSLLYSLSGASREAFARFPLPRHTPLFAPALNGEAVVRSDDVTRDPRYGQKPPHHGLPAGHPPVVSYLAVPVVSRSGAPIGALFFGHSRPGMFSERSEMLVTGVAAQAAIAMDNARLFRQAQRLISALERTNADLDQFAYVASHDLKAPLRGIASLSQWLEEDLGPHLNAESRRQLDLLRRRVGRMESLIEGILRYSRAGRKSGKPESIEVGRLLAEVVELLSPRPPASVELRGEWPTVFSERIPLQQVFMNLIGNALKHAGRPDARVTVSAAPYRDQFWQFSIADNGPGIAPAYHERIWGIFQTLEARDKVESTGIGLAIVKRIVEGRGGRAWVESAEGQGATFHFTWPKKDEATS